MKYFICFLLISQTATADVLYLPKNSTTPYTGYLFSEDAAQNARDTSIDRDKYKLLNESFKESLSIQSDQIKLYMEQRDIYKAQNDNLAKELTSSRQTTNFERILYFALGVAASVGAFYGVKQVAK